MDKERTQVMAIGNMDMIAPGMVAHVSSEPRYPIHVDRVVIDGQTSWHFDVLAVRVDDTVYGTSEIAQHMRRAEYLLLSVAVRREIVITCVNRGRTERAFIATAIGRTMGGENGEG